MNAPPDKIPTNPRLSQASIAPVAARAAPAPAQSAAVAEPAPDIGALVKRIFAHWQVVLVTLTLGGLITAQIVRTRKAYFKSETVISYREGIGASVTGAQPNPDAVKILGARLKEQLIAQQNLRRIIEEFHLYPELVSKGLMADAVDLMRKKTEFKSRSVETFAISFEGTKPEEAQKVAARMADILVTENNKRSAEETRGSSEFLEVEMKRVDEECERIEREESAFLRAHPEFQHGKDGIGIEARNKLQAEIDRQKKHSRGKGRLKPAANAPPGLPAPAAPGAPAAPAVDPVLITVRTSAAQELASAQKDLADKSARFTEAHPDVRAARERVASAQAALKRAEDALASAQPREEAPAAPSPGPAKTGDDPYADSSAKPADTAAPTADDKDKEDARPKRADPDGEILDVNLEMEWVRLERTLGLARTRQGDMEAKLYKAELFESTLESGYGSSISVLDPAFKPTTPSNMPNQIVLLIGLGASVAVGLLLSATWGMFLDDRLFSPGEVEASVMVPLLGFVPRDTRSRSKRKAAAGDAGKTAAKRRWGFSRG
jgi:uncharacterized protein involved in exopolysaccharide biosynthesis